MVMNTNTQETHTHTNTKIPTQNAHTGADTHKSTSTDTYGHTLDKKLREASREAIRYAAALQAWNFDPTI